jgi:hypothetical protein
MPFLSSRRNDVVGKKRRLHMQTSTARIGVGGAGLVAFMVGWHRWASSSHCLAGK